MPTAAKLERMFGNRKPPMAEPSPKPDRDDPYAGFTRVTVPVGARFVGDKARPMIPTSLRPSNGKARTGKSKRAQRPPVTVDKDCLTRWRKRYRIHT